eukprot:CAMPEP_0117017376 /NCGR_PEP_ID=MMETSP0472-20121206/13574_1 /TAXON_ID=693140 ORGANISM="Tiarina fusus, Strain LIS" /NCGR_SAMPLE_ID=MMETSP0472 /ASSEMBLY_ACC=CAM_ASM_000603 /LENGTH=427 /DNA_ID=CAMNT_0004721719 /DNA_START=305 /DNA_END=1588 /DNA_ORIENTATION=+
MGQCSTLPTEGRSAAGKREGGSLRRDDSASLRQKERGAKNSQGRKTSTLHVQTNSGQHQPPTSHLQKEELQARNPEVRSPNGADPMEEDNPREDIPQPPALAIRTRCYKLNLDANLNPQPNVCLGPFVDSPPPLTYTSSEDSCVNSSPTQIAIQTAKIFRGITVAKDGTILSQNARATRSNRGAKNKRGEKSRQATKIEKAKDLVEESILTGKAPSSDEPANMMSLFIMGEYDEMKHLVRDGSKKLRDATDLPDVNLLGINNAREGATVPLGVGLSSPRKRVSPNSFGGQHHASHSRMVGLPQSTPPKLRGHPRDRPSSRKQLADDKSRGRDPGAHTTERNHHVNGNGTDGDWSNALGLSRGFHSIWNCGGAGEDTGTISPTQVVHQKDGKSHAVGVVSAPPYRPVFEGRDSAFGQARESGVTARAI